MTQPGNPTNAEHAPLGGIPQAAEIQQLGRVGVHAVAPGELTAPKIDIEVNAIEPAHYAPAGARPYLGSAKRGPDIIRNQDDPQEGAKASEYARGTFPNSTFTYLGGGRYGVVLADETGKAFKIYRSAAEAYSRYEKEAGALQVLSAAGLAPRLHLFVDADKEYRLDLKPQNYTAFGFEDVVIPRQDGGRELPIMVMDRVDAAPLESAEPEKLVEGFCRAANVFMENDIRAWDAEVVVDNKSGDLVILDVGELSQLPFDAESASPQARLEHESEILRYLSLDFGFGHSADKIQATYREGGLNAVRDYLTQLTQAT